ncbi:AAA family ATPase [Ancylobacter sp. VNQ12]|uniref:AAA family ATPase n=1 Tax=Ancylobacter sp. VNQ12 TaxID=3400920 RepID=UPI003C07E808
MTDASDLVRHMEGVARLLLGEPNKHMSTKGELRFGSNGSLSVDLKKGVAADHESGEGGGVLWLIQRQTGRANGAAVEWMRENGFEIEDRQDHQHHAAPARQQQGERREIEATYDYVSETGELLYQVVRQVFTLDGKPVMTKDGAKRKKTFSQRRPAPDEPNVWINALDAGTFMRKGPGANWSRFDEEKFKAWGFTERRDFDDEPPPVLYRLPEVIEALANESMVLIVEGEKKADALWALGIPATCNAGGSKKWRPEFNEVFRAGNVVVLPDNDDTGRQHAAIVAAGLNGIAARVRVLELSKHWPICPTKGDIVDWLNAGGTATALFDMIKATAPWAPALVSRFKAMTLDQIDYEPQADEYIIDGLYTVGDTAIVGGASQAGKTFFAIGSAMAVAMEKEFLGHKVMRNGLVVYQAGESPRGVKKRLRAYLRRYGIVPSGRIPFVLLPAKIDLYSPDGDTAALITELKAIEASYGMPVLQLYVDTVAKAQGAADENSGKDMAVILGNVDRIKAEVGCQVTLVHHMNAAGAKLRGHTSLYANSDQVVLVTLDEATRIRTALVDKQKDDEGGRKIKFELESVEVGIRDDGKPLTSCVCVRVGERQIMERKQASAGLPLRGQEEPIFRALMLAIKEKGTVPTPEMVAAGVPGDVMAVHYNDWRDAFKQVGAPEANGEAQSDDAIRKMFKRYVVERSFVRNKIIGFSRPYLWWWGAQIKGFPETAPKIAGQEADRSRTSGFDDAGDHMADFGEFFGENSYEH